ncbi:MAG: hypothetical protein PHI34_05210 [Acidobacteriota bacterium]|nr:hypothetical protein [Acidobacteriota bacterium]
MRSRTCLRAFSLGLLFLASGFAPLRAQVGLADAAERAKWEDFLRTARIGESVQMGGANAVTNPWKLTLTKDGVTRFGLWKDIDTGEDTPDRFRFEIAAYRMDVLLGLDLVPPSVERRFQGRPGSVQLWMDGTESLKARTAKGTEVREANREAWNLKAYVQRAFDSLIANEDRNANNILVDAEDRMMLIDHSRSFRTAKPFSERLVFGAGGLMRTVTGTPYPFSKLPRAFVDKLRALDAKSVRTAAKGSLTAKEIEVLLRRRDLLLEEVATLVGEKGEAEVLY